jgi:hypothetical protein
MSGVVEATETAFRKHPVWVVGGFAGLVLVLYLFTKSSGSSSAPATIAYQVGPSDASVQAGTALQIAQVQANSAAFQASTQAQAQGTVASDYFDYLNNAATLQAGTMIHGQDVAGALGVVQSNNSYSSAINGQNAALALGTVQSNNALNGTISTNTTASQIANYQAATTQAVSYNNMQGKLAMYNANVAGSNNQTQVQLATIGARAAQQGSVDYQNSLITSNLMTAVNQAGASGQSLSYIQELERAAQVAFTGNTANGNGF